MSGAGRMRAAAVSYLNARSRSTRASTGSRQSAPRAAATPRGPAGGRAARIAEDEADIGLMPVAAAASIGDLRLVRGCAVGARGPVRSIVIVADRPIDELDELAVDLSSRTSVVLGRLVLRARRKGREPRLFGATARDALAGVSGSRGKRS